VQGGGEVTRRVAGSSKGQQLLLHYIKDWFGAAAAAAVHGAASDGQSM